MAAKAYRFSSCNSDVLSQKETPNSFSYLRQMLTDRLKDYFTGTFSSKLAVP